MPEIQISKNIIQNNNAKTVVLVAPLDWGLGHTTRCMVLIKELLLLDCEVHIACSAAQQLMLQQEFPLLTYHFLEGYNLKYGSNRWQTIVKLIIAIPKILTAINKENKWLTAFCNSKHLDVIISDNRYGFRHKSVLSVFLTHQLQIKTPFGRIGDYCVQQLNYAFINRFDRCWVPDYIGADNLAGVLSHPHQMPHIPVTYTGPLSRIKVTPAPAKKSAILIILSGPEPQRSIFEQKIVQQLESIQEPVTLVRGILQATPLIYNKPNLTIYDYCNTDKMQQLIHEADLIISRPGYTTVMELIPLGKKYIFIPTPGQTEQEYLARYLAEKKLCITAAQYQFSLPVLIASVKKQSLALFNPGDTNLLKTAVTALLQH